MESFLVLAASLSQTPAADFLCVSHVGHSTTGPDYYSMRIRSSSLCPLLPPTRSHCRRGLHLVWAIIRSVGQGSRPVLQKDFVSRKSFVAMLLFEFIYVVIRSFICLRFIKSVRVYFQLRRLYLASYFSFYSLLCDRNHGPPAARRV